METVDSLDITFSAPRYESARPKITFRKFKIQMFKSFGNIRIGEFIVHVHTMFACSNMGLVGIGDTI